MSRTSIVVLTLCAVAVAAGLTGCPTGGAAKFSVYPVAFSFGPGNLQNSFAITNTASQPLAWSIDPAELPAWLTVTPMSGEVAFSVQNVQISVDPTSLPAGANQTTFTIQTASGNQTISVAASSTPTGDTPLLSVTPGTLDFGGSDITRTFTVANPGTAALAWEVDTSTLQSWVTNVSPASGSVQPNGQQVVQVTVSRLGLALGDYDESLAVLSNADVAQVALTMAVQSLVLTPTTLDLTTTAPADSVVIENRGSAALDWQIDISSAPNWLVNVTPSTGNLAAGATQTVDITTNPDVLTTGTYTTQLPVTSSDGSEALVVNLHVAALDVSPLSFNFGPDQTSQALTLTNSGDTAINWSITIPQSLGWLSAGTLSGRIEAQTSTPVQLQVDRNNLLPGSYSGTFTLLSEDGNAEIAVSMEVPLGAPTLELSPTTLNFGSFLSAQQLALWNSGSGTVTWQINSNSFPAWLSVSPTDGGGIAGGDLTSTDTALLTVSVNRAIMNTGTNNATILVTATGDGNSLPTISIPVTVIVPPIPEIQLQVNGTTAQEVIIPSPDETATFTIRNTGTGLLEWSIENTDPPAWLTSVTAESRPLARNDSVTVTIKVDRKNAAASDAQTLLIHSNDPARATASMQVELHVPNREKIAVTPEQVDMTRDDNSALFSVANGGDPGTTLTFEVEVAEKDRQWLFVSPLRGTSYRYPPPAPLDWVDISISIDRSNLDPDGETGFGYGTIHVTGIANGDYTIDAYDVKVSVDPSPLTFEAAVARTRIPSLVRNVMLMRNLKFRPINLELGLDQLDLNLDGALSYDELNAFWPNFSGQTFDDIAGDDGLFTQADLAPGQPDPFPHMFLNKFKDDFALFENDKPLELTETHQFLSSGSRLKTNIAIMLDYTGSMEDSAKFAQQHHQDLVDRGLASPDPNFLASDDPLQYVYEKCVEQLINELPDYFRVALLEFHDRSQGVFLVEPFTRNDATGKADLITALRSLPNQIEDHGASEILLAAESAAAYITNEDTRLHRIPFDDADIRGLVFFSDGRITTPPGKIKDTIDYLVATKVRFFPVSWGQAADHEPLSRLAVESGGHYYPTFAESFLVDNGDGTQSTLSVPNLAQLFDICNTGTPNFSDDPGAVGTPEDFRCDQSIAKDLSSHIVLSYVSLNEENNTTSSVSASFDDPDDNPEGLCLRNKGVISGNFKELLDLKDVVGDVRRGQISLNSDGIRGTTATVYIRADYVPRNVNKFDLSFRAISDATLAAIPFTVQQVVAENGGLIPDWTADPALDPAPILEASYRFDAPEGYVLPYGAFGDLLKVSFDNVDGPFTFELTVDNAIYSVDIQPKHFMYPDSLAVREESMAASAFPTPSVRLPGSTDEVTILTYANDEDTKTVEIRNSGGNYPYPATNPLTQAFLTWEFTSSDGVAISPLSGAENTTLDFTSVTLTPDRSLPPGDHVVTLEMAYTTGDLGLVGSVPILVSWTVLPPVLDVDPPSLDFGTTEVIQRFQVLNKGQSTLAFEVDPQTPLPSWIVSVTPDSGKTTATDPVTVTVTVSRTALAAASSFNLKINGYVDATEEPVGSMTIPITIAP